MLCFFPAIVLGCLGYVEVYVYPKIALVQQLFNMGYLDPSNVRDPGYPIWLLILSEISGLSTINLFFLPIGAFLFSLMYFCIARKIFENSAIAFFFAIYSTWDISLMGEYNATFYALTHPIYLLFILLILQLRETKKTKILCCLYMFFIGSFLIHSEAPLWMIVAIVIINSASLMENRLKKNDRAKIKMGHLAAFSFIIIFLSFNSLFYDVWIKRLKNFNPSEPLSLLLTSKLKPGPWTAEKYLTSLYDPLLNWLRILQYMIIFLPIFLAILSNVRKFIMKSGRIALGQKEMYLYLWFMFIVTAFIDAVAYSVVGWVSLKYIGLVFPILTIVSLYQLGVKKNFRVVILSILMALVFSNAILYMNSLHERITRYNDIEAGADWLFKNSPQGKMLLTDLPTYGKFLIKTVIYNTSFTPCFYNSHIYEELFILNSSSVNISSSLEKKFDYLVVDYKSCKRPIQTIGNKYYEPLLFHLHNIDNKVALHRVYVDNIVLIFESNN